MTISSSLNFGGPAPPGRRSAAGGGGIWFYLITAIVDCVYGGLRRGEFICSALLQPARSVCISLSAFFINLFSSNMCLIIMSPVDQRILLFTYRHVRAFVTMERTTLNHLKPLLWFVCLNIDALWCPAPTGRHNALTAVVCLSVPCLKLNRQRKGLVSWSLAGRKPVRRWHVTQFKGRKVTRPLNPLDRKINHIFETERPTNFRLCTRMEYDK